MKQCTVSTGDPLIGQVQTTEHFCEVLSWFDGGAYVFFMGTEGGFRMQRIPHLEGFPGLAFKKWLV